MSDTTGTQTDGRRHVPHPGARGRTTIYLTVAALLVVAAISQLAEDRGVGVAVAFAAAAGVGFALARRAWTTRS